jgi:four helix bundle protein
MEKQNPVHGTRTYKDLIIWRKSIDLVTILYKATAGFPRSEMIGITSQIRRACVSIPSNIAEGFGRRSKMDFVRFCQIAMGSLYEVQTQLLISNNLGYLTQADYDRLYESSREIERMLSSFIDHLKGK